MTESVVMDVTTTEHSRGRELMARVVERDRDAFAELYDLTSTLVFSIAVRVLSDRALAEDLVQDVYTTVWTRPLSYDPEKSNVTTWIAVVARNAAIDRLRKKRREVSIDPVERGEELAAPRGSASAAASEIGQPAEVDDRLLADDRSNAVHRALATMPPRQREVLELMYFSGMSQTEVSEKIGVPLGTVKSRAFHAMQRMQELLKVAGVTA